MVEAKASGGSGPTAGPGCPLCGLGLQRRYDGIVADETGEMFGVVACPGCGLGRTHPTPPDLDPYYRATYYGNRHGLTARYCARRRLRLVGREAGAGRSLLDYGSGDGGFARAARADGWDVCGVERHRPDPAPADPPVVSGLDELEGRPPFDAATFWHVLEHLDDPVDVLTRLRRHLKSGAFVVAAVPNFGSWQARAAGASWLHLDIPRHLSHFTARSLARTFEAGGYRAEVRARGEWEYDVIGWSQGLLNRHLGGRNEFFRAMSGRPDAGPAPRRRVQVAAGLGLSALAALPAWGEGRIDRAGTLIAVARPLAGGGDGHA